jgi:hypothetical protein
MKKNNENVKINKMCNTCKKLNKDCKGMAKFYSGCIYYKKKMMMVDSKKGAVYK